MYVVTVLFEVASEHAGAFREAVLRQAEASLARESACRRFDVCADPARPGRVFLYEIYDDEAAFRRHLESDHFRAFDGTVAPWVRDKTVTTWELLPGTGEPRR